jgi:hypothetical protein
VTLNVSIDVTLIKPQLGNDGIPNKTGLRVYRRRFQSSLTKQGDQKIWGKNRPIFLKVCKAKKAKISTTKLYLKAPNIYIKPLLKP